MNMIGFSLKRRCPQTAACPLAEAPPLPVETPDRRNALMLLLVTVEQWQGQESPL
jgi:hypothetical protein